ncbi:transposase [bacterium]|nr:transposase [bacterium]
MHIIIRQFTGEYKLETVRLSYQRGSIVELASELGLRPSLIYRWRSEFETSGEKKFSG